MMPRARVTVLEASRSTIEGESLRIVMMWLRVPHMKSTARTHQVGCVHVDVVDCVAGLWG